MITITTARLTISPMENDGLRKLIAQYRDSIPELSLAYGEMLESCIQHPEDAAFYTAWEIRLLADNAVIGYAGFKGIQNRSVEIGYGIDEPLCGNGYATEAVGALCRWVLQQPGVDAVTAETEPNNAASRRVLQKIGFILTGAYGAEGPIYSYHE